MLVQFLDKLAGFLDKRFLIAFWSPLFVAVHLVGAGWVVLLEPEELTMWWSERAPWTQTLLLFFALLLITAGAFILEALTRPVVRTYEGYWPDWLKLLKTLKSDQHRATIERLQGDTFDPRLYFEFPRDKKRVRPTRLGNILTAAEDYPSRVYGMDGVIWWPRLTVLLPDAYRSQMDAATTSLLALLNLSATIGLLSAVSAASAWFGGWPCWVGSAFALAGGLLAWGVYTAATSQALDYAQTLRVGFDLYRHRILQEMRIPVPTTLLEERHLWNALNELVYEYQLPWQNNWPPNLSRIPVDKRFVLSPPTTIAAPGDGGGEQESGTS